jgi:hypothetical protein
MHGGGVLAGAASIDARHPRSVGTNPISSQKSARKASENPPSIKSPHAQSGSTACPGDSNNEESLDSGSDSSDASMPRHKRVRPRSIDEDGEDTDNEISVLRVFSAPSKAVSFMSLKLPSSSASLLHATGVISPSLLQKLALDGCVGLPYFFHIHLR